MVTGDILGGGGGGGNPAMDKYPILGGVVTLLIASCFRHLCAPVVYRAT